MIIEELATMQLLIFIEREVSFFIPSLNERQEQKKGDLVRLHFILNNPSESSPRAEKMWVEIAEKKLFSKKYIGPKRRVWSCLRKKR